MMSSETFKRHISRLRSSLAAHSPDTICDFITQHTYLNGQKFSFAGHEYQQEILNDPAQTIIITKSAQLGISEMSARLALARCALIVTKMVSVSWCASSRWRNLSSVVASGADSRPRSRPTN